MHTGYDVPAPSTTATVKQTGAQIQMLVCGFFPYLLDYFAENLKARQPGVEDESKFSGCGSSFTQCRIPCLPNADLFAF